MALQKEIWIDSIVGGLFADNTFAARSVDHSVWVNNKTVHVPNAGAPSNVEINRSVFPAQIKQRADLDLTYDMVELTVDPVRVPHAETVELSYNKRESIIAQNRLQLHSDGHEYLITSWLPTGVTKVETEGAASNSYLPGAAGQRKRFTKQTVIDLYTMFNAANLPTEGRCIMLDAYMYADLLVDLTDSEKVAFLAGGDPVRGVIGKYMGFEFFNRSRVTRTDDTGIVKPWSAAGDPDDCAGGIAWHSSCVARALGETVFFDNPGDATYYGDIFSLLQRVGGHWIRADKVGIYLIKQAKI